MNIEFLTELANSMWALWLMIMFLGVVFFAFRPKNRKRFEEYGAIPFKNDENGG